jgi:hypothetical protein
VEGHLVAFLSSIQVEKNDVVLAYFACHGEELKGKNYLLPCGFSKFEVKEDMKKSPSDDKPKLTPAQVDLQLKQHYKNAIEVGYLVYGEAFCTLYTAVCMFLSVHIHFYVVLVKFLSLQFLMYSKSRSATFCVHMGIWLLLFCLFSSLEIFLLNVKNKFP